MKTKGKRVALTAGAAALIVLALAAWYSCDHLREAWCIREYQAEIRAQITRLRDQDLKVRARAAEYLFQSESEDTLIPLVEAIEDELIAPDMFIKSFVVRGCLPDLVSRIPKDSPVLARAVPILLRMTRARVAGIADMPWETLAKVGPPAAPALSIAIEALEGTDDEAHDAAWFLYNMGPLGAPAVPALLDKLSHGNTNLRLGVSAALGNIGPAAREAKAAFIEIAQDPAEDPGLRSNSIRGLPQIAPFDVDALRCLLEILNQDRVPYEVQIAAVQALAEFIDRSDDAFRALLKVIEDEEADNVPRIKAIEGLWKSPHRIEEALPALIRLVEGQAEVLQCSAATAIAKLGKAAYPALPALKLAYARERLRDKGPGLIACTIIEIDPTALSEQEIEEVFRDNWNARFLADHALGARGMPALIELLRREESADDLAMEALREVGAPAVPSLIDVLATDDPKFRCAIAKALGQLGPTAWAALPALRRSLWDRDAEFRRECVQAILRIKKR